MTKPVKIEDRKVIPMFYKKRPVVTLHQIDDFHGRVDGTARRNFNSNKKHFIKDRDYFEVPYAEYSQLLTVRNSYGQRGTATRNSCSGSNKKEAGGGTKFVPPPNKGGSRVDMIFLTETGYLMVVKSLTDDKAWAVHRAMVETYFNKRVGYQKVTPEEIKAFNTDILTLGTKATAEKYGRSLSCIKKYTTETRSSKAVQLSLFE